MNDNFQVELMSTWKCFVTSVRSPDNTLEAICLKNKLFWVDVVTVWWACAFIAQAMNGLRAKLHKQWAE